jgi:uncharacterized protein
VVDLFAEKVMTSAPQRVSVQHAVSIFKATKIDGEQRIVEGFATTPELDLVGDSVAPRGGLFKLPLPLLLNHRSDEPVGQIVHAEVLDGGIRIRAQIAQVDSPPSLRDRLDGAWTSVKQHLVRGFSIGFVSIESSPIPSTGGRRHTMWRWLETSLVVLPACTSATIDVIKAADLRHRVGHSPARDVVHFARGVVRLDGDAADRLRSAPHVVTLNRVDVARARRALAQDSAGARVRRPGVAYL